MPLDPKLSALRILPLIGSDLHIWTAALHGSNEQLAYFDSLLSADEKKRAERFYFERDRNRYIFGRGILRTLLAGYLKTEATEIRFAYGPYGKPELDLFPEDAPLQFNLAHCNDWAACVFGWRQPLGIDIEHIRPVNDVDELVQRFFTASESKLIHSLSGDAKWETFFKIWTCKEAILKAHGSGLTVPLNDFEISLGANNSVTITSAAEQLTGWNLRIVELVAGYQSAIAVRGNIGKILVHSFSI